MLCDKFNVLKHDDALDTPAAAAPGMGLFAHDRRRSCNYDMVAHRELLIPYYKYGEK